MNIKRALAPALSLVICSQSSQATASSTYQFVVMDQISHIHPLMTQPATNSLLRNLLHSPLLRIDDKSRLHSKLLQDDIQSSGAIFRKTLSNGDLLLRLKSDATWGDGLHISINDVLFSWQLGRFLQANSIYHKIKQIYTDPAHPLQIRLSLSKTVKIEDLSEFYIVPHHLEAPIWRQWGSSRTDYLNHSLYQTSPLTAGLFSGDFVVTAQKGWSELELKQRTKSGTSQAGLLLNIRSKRLRAQVLDQLDSQKAHLVHMDHQTCTSLDRLSPQLVKDLKIIKVPSQNHNLLLIPSNSDRLASYPVRQALSQALDVLGQEELSKTVVSKPPQGETITIRTDRSDRKSAQLASLIQSRWTALGLPVLVREESPHRFVTQTLNPKPNSVTLVRANISRLPLTKIFRRSLPQNITHSKHPYDHKRLLKQLITQVRVLMLSDEPDCLAFHPELDEHLSWLAPSLNQLARANSFY